VPVLAMPDLTLSQFDSCNHQARPMQTENEPKLTLRSYLGHVNTVVGEQPVLSVSDYDYPSGGGQIVLLPEMEIRLECSTRAL
jgi:hypothetical protein